MSKEKPTHVAASIRQRLLNLSNERKEEFQFVLVRYAVERLLYRLSKSPYAGQFLLKGAMLFQLWTGQPHRSTLDLDLLGQGDDAVVRFEAMFREVCNTGVEDDGLRFLTEKIHGEEIREEQRYSGVRIRGVVLLGTAKIPLQIDIGFGDAVTPKPLQAEYPSLLGQPTATMQAYPKETVVAEKFEAMVSRGIANSRMKDFYDIWVLASKFNFDGAMLGRAIRATFERRKTAIPTVRPLALTSEFSGNLAKQGQWQGFVNRGRLAVKPPTLDIVVGRLKEFLWPVTESLVNADRFNKKWSAGSWA